MKVVIIGGGSAGVSVATRLRRMDENADIVILEKSNEFAVAACGYTYLLSGIIKDEEDLLGASVEQMKQIFKVEVKLNHKVIGIDRENKKLQIENRNAESYDKLVIATGAQQLRPDIAGILGENIFTISSLENVAKIKDYYFGTEAKNVLILGGGDIGIEAAEAFVQLKAKVFLVEKNSHILPYMDKDMAQKLEQELQSKGVKLFLGQQVSAFGDKVANLKNGKNIKFDMAIIATGVKPDVALPIMANLDIGEHGGILVNKHMQTNDEDIYACGDNVEVLNRITGKYERWPNAANALKQAKVVADHIAGKNISFAGFVGTNIAKVFDYTAAISGCSETKLKNAGIKYNKIFVNQLNHAGYYPKPERILLKLLFAANGRILGMQIIGRAGVADRINAISALIEQNGTVYDLAELEVAYAPPYSLAKDALNNAGSLAQEVIEGKLKTMSTDELDDNFLPIDIRAANVFRLGHLPRALNFPLASLRDNLDELPRNQKLAIYCNHGYGAYLAYQILSQRGFDNAYLLFSNNDV